MAAKRKQESKDPPSPKSTTPQDIAELDSLIEECFKEIKASLKGKAKLGDLIKMIELRRKLAPGDSAQREFWKMLERIRSEKLPDRGTPKDSACDGKDKSGTNES